MGWPPGCRPGAERHKELCMAEEKYESREWDWHHYAPWTVLFRGFQVALDPKKLLLAAAGIMAMAFGWWLLAVIFFSARAAPPIWPTDYQPFADAETKNQAWAHFKLERPKWNL